MEHESRPEDEDRITHLDEVRAAHNVVAAFPSLAAARAAIEALEAAGTPADSLALLGARPKDDTDLVDGTPGQTADGEAADQVGRSVAAGASAGGAVGGALGALAGLTIPGFGPVVGAGIWAIMGAGAGGVLGGVSGEGGSSAWYHTFEAVQGGNVAVGVHADDDEVVDDAQSVLEGLEPLAINRF